MKIRMKTAKKTTAKKTKELDSQTPMRRVHNFSAGPAMLPATVLDRIGEELHDWRGSGMSVMEMSHRGPQFSEIARNAERDFRSLLGISDEYAVLFLQGGATGQFAMVPLNLSHADQTADYLITGSWSKKAVEQARLYCNVNVVADTSDTLFTCVPEPASWQPSGGAAYFHYTPNETIHGVEFGFIPDSDTPLVADMSSTILSHPLDVDRFGVIYAGAQKNIGPAGLTMVIVRRDLLDRARAEVPVIFNYEQQAAAGSMLNTPPTFSWYVAGLVFEWLIQKGGLAAMETINRGKAEKLYLAIDKSSFYANPVEPGARSLMNIPFTLADPALDTTFLEQAEANELVNLKGHRSLGGMRASIYNAMPEEGIDALIEFMEEFERANS